MKNMLMMSAVVVMAGLSWIAMTGPANASTSVLALCDRHNYTVRQGERTGIYAGKWRAPGSSAEHVLIVLDVKQNGSATVLYAIGPWPEFGIAAECTRFRGRFLDSDTLRITFRNNRSAQYEFSGNSAAAKYTSPNGVTRGDIRRIRQR